MKGKETNDNRLEPAINRLRRHQPAIDTATESPIDWPSVALRSLQPHREWQKTHSYDMPVE